MHCKYCNAVILPEPITLDDKILPICFSKICIAQYSFEHCNNLIEVYNESIRKFLLDLAKSGSSKPDRFSPIPIGFDGDLNTPNFMNYLQLSLGNVKLIEDDFQISETKGFKSYTFDYTHDPWSNFTYLFHGSPYHNWHSITRNGLKNYSGTDKMTTGAIWGPGIYFSDDLGFSFGYAGSSYGGKYAIGVFEVKEPDKKQIDGMKEFRKTKILLTDKDTEFDDDIRAMYRRTTNIFVVPYEENVRIKYLVLIPNMENLSSFSGLLIKYFILRLRDMKNAKPRFNALSTKRITNEKKNSLALIPDLKIDETPGIWNCSYGTNLFSVKFPEGYPLICPEITIKNYCKNIQLFEGRVCMEPLYNWKLNNRLEYVLLSLVMEFFESTNLVAEQKEKNMEKTTEQKFGEFFAKKIAESANPSNSPVVTNWISVKNNLELIKYLN